MTFALGAGDLFDLNCRSEYVETIIAKCINKYIELRGKQFEELSDRVVIDKRLESIVNKMFERCYMDGEYKQAIGIALEARRNDAIEAAIKKGNPDALLSYVLDVCMTVVQNRGYRNEVLRLLVKLFENLADPDYITMSQCLVHLNDPKNSSKLLQTLVEKKADQHLLLAYQIAFDFEDNATQDFLQKVAQYLPPGRSNDFSEKPSDEMETDEVETDKDTASPHSKTFGRIREILAGKAAIRLNLEFLYLNNKSDLLIIKNSKNYLESRSSLYHSAVTFSNAFMHSGTTNDDFLRQNLEWLSRATNWSKFNATAALGLIHKGHISQGLALLQPYLPKDGISGSAYSEGGSLYALGLVNANHGGEALVYLHKTLKGLSNEVLQHGACLGIGVCGMATGDNEIYEDVKNVLFTDSAVAGEAAGIALGLLMLGTASQKAIDEMLQYARETQHEKIIRGLAMGISLIMFGLEERADVLIEQLLADKASIYCEFCFL